MIEGRVWRPVTLDARHRRPQAIFRKFKLASMSPRVFTQTRVIKWGECDPAGIVYTPRILDYAMETVEAWYRDVLGVPWVKLNAELHLGSPMEIGRAHV